LLSLSLSVAVSSTTASAAAPCPWTARFGQSGPAKRQSAGPVSRPFAIWTAYLWAAAADKLQLVAASGAIGRSEHISRQRQTVSLILRLVAELASLQSANWHTAGLLPPQMGALVPLTYACVSFRLGPFGMNQTKDKSAKGNPLGASPLGPKQNGGEKKVKRAPLFLSCSCARACLWARFVQTKLQTKARGVAQLRVSIALILGQKEPEKSQKRAKKEPLSSALDCLRSGVGARRRTLTG